MESDIIYEEVQGAANKGIANLFKLITLFLIASFIIQLVLRNYQLELILLLLTGGTVSAVISLFLSIRMITQIRRDSIHVKFPPFRPSVFKYSWTKIAKVYIRKYDPITEYGGWGLRFGPSGRAVSIAGNIGIQIIFKDGSRLLIGTSKPDKIAAALMNIGVLDPYDLNDNW